MHWFQRKFLKEKSHQHLSMGVAWIIPDECERFRKGPELIYVYGTVPNNEEKCTLMKVSEKDISGTMVNILRAFIPNQRNWAFKFLFWNLFPTLSESYTLYCFRFIIIDGDGCGCGCNQMHAAIKMFMSNTTRVRRGWHIIDRGMGKGGNYVL